MNGDWREILWPEGAVWLSLLALLVLTILSAFMPLGSFGTAANLGIAAVKALLVAAFFMHLRQSPGLNRLAVALGLLWLSLLLVLTVGDLLARSTEMIGVTARGAGGGAVVLPGSPKSR